MAAIIRKIIEIDEELCNGCGQCVPACAEGALSIVNGKARVVRDMFCDGLGACLGECPTGALRIIEREADPFDEEAAMAHVERTRVAAGGGCPGTALRTFAPHGGGCPGSAMATFDAASGAASADAPSRVGDLMHWPVQIRLIPPHAPFLNGADLIVAADCAPVAMPDFHARFVGGNAVMIGCPKFDDAGYVERFRQLFSTADVRSVTVVRMEVPCCQGLPVAVREGLRQSGRDVPYREVVVGRRGDILPVSQRESQ
ncbi:NAD-dependent dihydropyrimidine dehydrogenase PreA subunit [Desulfobaculum xiamenense]|uniref:NAD-dependent dihydropyrimidine dehydrogenase PreA subunit n=1 Tax=Desulfobaculum xiamenense TaxID=995050 RepID=A0A846QMM3_9BACT|nr:4Fe-4S binding protein [Desulfobaculum xiamenense]NJB67712.1 NAD-dependent dihydropyrimidine dehydrogenase PreA subunit [Desulfobaculum xiamenense]